MRAIVALIGAALVHIAGCQASPADVEAQRGEGACDEPRFIAGLQECDTKLDLSVAFARKGDARNGCLALGEYRACLSGLIGATGCGNRKFLSRQLRSAQAYLQQDKLCAGNTSAPPQYAPLAQGNQAHPDICAKDAVWNTQFVCAQKFHKDLDKAREDEKGAGTSQICRSVRRYYRCLNVLHGQESCRNDTDFMQHVEYFPTVLTHKYRDLCPAQVGLKTTQYARVKVLRAIGVVGQSADQSCEQDKKTKEFFACGLLFNVIVSRNPAKEKICTAYKNLENCTQQLQCSAPSDFNTHSMRVVDVLLTPYDKYCRGFVPSDKNHTGLPPTPGPSNATPAVCNEDLYLERYFECGLMYLYGLTEANMTDHEQGTNLVCDLIRKHKSCVDNIKTLTNCPLGISIHANLEYFDKELRETPRPQCPSGLLKASARKRFRATKQKCHLREYAGSYFKCGVTFLQATFPNRPPDDEACRHYAQFMKCVAYLIPCRQEGDIQPHLNHFSEVLTEGYKERCKGRNVTDICEKLVLIKDFFACSMTYYQSYNEFGRSYLLTKPHICKLLEDYGKCTFDKVLKTACESLKELYHNAREVRNYIAKRFNERHKSSCSFPAEFQRQSGPLAPMVARQSSCDQFGAVKKLVLCGVAFHRMLASSAEGNTSAAFQLEEENATTAVCLLVKEMNYCMYSATRDSGCSEAVFLNTEISAFRKRLLMEFEDACNTLPWSDNGTVGGHKERQSCELKDFTQEWEACDTTMKNGLSLYYQNASVRGRPAITNLQRRMLCSNLVGYRRCVRESAGKHHCPALAPGLADLGRGELFQRLGLVACSSSTSPRVCWTAQLMGLASVVYLLARESVGWWH